MEEARVYIPIVETLKKLEDSGWTNNKTGSEIREEVIRKITEAVGFACNYLVEKEYITPTAEGFKLVRDKWNELYEKYQ